MLSISAATKALRQLRGQSQQSFSNDLGASLMTVSRWESGKYRPSTPVLHKLLAIARKTEGARPVVESLETFLITSTGDLNADRLAAVHKYLTSICNRCAEVVHNTNLSATEARSEIIRALHEAQEAESLVDAMENSRGDDNA